MKKIIFTALSCALIGSSLFAQSGTRDEEVPQNLQPRAVEWPAAYMNSTSTVHAETSSGAESITININKAHTGEAYYGSYGEPRPSGFGESLIYTNGPIVDTYYEPLLSIVQGNLGLDLLGAGVQKGSTNSLADDFTLGEDFDISKVDFYLYQTDESSTSITAAYIQIWDGDPSAGGNVIWGDLSTNIIDGVVLTNIRRVTDSDQTSQRRKIQKVTAATSNLSLNAGTYYIQATFEGSGSSGPWMPPITVEGEVWTGDAIQFTGGSNNWQPLVDTSTGDPQGMPFELYGVPSASGDTCLEINPHYDWVFEEGWTISDIYITANDLTVDAGTDFTLQTIIVPLVGEWPITNLNIKYHEDNNGEPGNQIGSEDSPTISNITAIGGLIGNPGLNVYRVEIELTPFEFSGQATSDTTYWIGIEGAENGHGTNSHWGSTTGNTVGNEAYQYNDNSGVWTRINYWDGNYTFKGECSDILGVEDSQMESLGIYPNPATEVLHLTAEKSLGKISLYNMLGQEVMHIEEEGSSADLNISHLPVGTYILKNDNDAQSQSYKIIKK